MMMIHLFALITAASVGCGASPPAPTPEPVARHTLAPGETATVAGGSLQLRFDDVVSDSRCPTGEQCVWAGRAEVALTITADGESTAHRVFAPGASPSAVVHGRYSIELVELAPYPKASREIPKGEYRATFEVRPE